LSLLANTRALELQFVFGSKSQLLLLDDFTRQPTLIGALRTRNSTRCRQQTDSGSRIHISKCAAILDQLLENLNALGDVFRCN